MSYDIAVIVDSLRKDSFNRKLGRGLMQLAPADFTFKETQIGDLPLYNQDDDVNQVASVKRLKSEIAGAKGLLFVTPEYNRSISGVLKNANRETHGVESAKALRGTDLTLRAGACHEHLARNSNHETRGNLEKTPQGTTAQKSPGSVENFCSTCKGRD